MKILKVSFYTIMILFLAWFVVSWVDVVSDNCFPNAVHHAWNMFLVMKGWGV